MNIQVEKTLEAGVKKYKETRKYTTDTRAANELIRIGLEIVEEIEEEKHKILSSALKEEKKNE